MVMTWRCILHGYDLIMYGLMGWFDHDPWDGLMGWFDGMIFSGLYSGCFDGIFSYMFMRVKWDETNATFSFPVVHVGKNTARSRIGLVQL